MKRILFLTNDDNSPSGGRRVIYWMVDVLNQHGFDAYALHSTPGYKYSWFSNSTRVAWCTLPYQSMKLYPYLRTSIKNLLLRISGHNSKRIVPTENDIVVVPETRIAGVHAIWPNVTKVILNQGPYLTLCRNFKDSNPPRINYFKDDVKAMITFSDLNYQMAKYTFPSLPIYKIQLFVDESIFHFSNKKKLQIAYMPRKGKADIRGVLNMLRFRGSLDHVRLVAIDGMQQEMVAKTLQESLIYLTFSNREGFGLPAAEAMACGCLVVGNHGGGGAEFFESEYCYPVDDGDYLSAVSAIEYCLSQFENELSSVREMGMRASETILEKYSMIRAEEDLLRVWAEVLLEKSVSPRSIY